jgi:hypothetical protein
MVIRTGPSTDRAERSRRLKPFFELQLQLARRVAEVTGRPVGEAVLRNTTLHRRFGLGVTSGAPAPAWKTFADALERAPDLATQVALAQAEFLGSPDEVLPEPGRIGFGCFACDDAPGADGSVQIHFHNADTDSDGGPLVFAKLARRKAEVSALIAHLGAQHPDVTHIKGRSWLYNLAAYRRIFPSDYCASGRPVGPEPVNLHGNSLWGQAIDSRERVRPDVRDAIMAKLPSLDPDAPWTVFPLGVIATRAAIRSFETFYGLSG